MATVLITGANRGIGLELCKQLQQRGDQVIAACRKASEELKQLDVRTEEGVDVTSEPSLAKLAESLGDTQLDLLVCNAGILERNTLSEPDFDSMRRQLEVNSLGPLRTVVALRDNLRQGAKIGLITSRMGSIADNTSGSAYGYRMSKAALNMAGVSLAQDLADDGIAVAILHPGFVKTEMTGNRGNVSASEAAAQLIERLDQLTPDSSGSFWHANGETLPW